SFDRDIPAGADFEKAIAVALTQCDVLLLILTEAATRSEWVIQELELASQFKKGIVPVVIGEIALPERMNDLLAGIVRIQMAKRPGVKVLDRIAGSIRNTAKSARIAARSEQHADFDAGQDAIYISYASEDRPRVNILVESLQRAGLNVWFDREQLQ